MKSWEPGISHQSLKKRASLLRQVREFFFKRDVLEVDTPSISKYSTVDLHIDSITVQLGSRHPSRYLITSPEYHMKRLLSAGSGSIYQICKSFRQEECGSRHNPEFTMLEWYRVGADHWQLMQEVDALMSELLGLEPSEKISYREIFEKNLGINPFKITLADFSFACKNANLTPPDYLLSESIDPDEWLNFLMGFLIEPTLGKETPVFIYNYPATQAALAMANPDDPNTALRFELYYKGMELGNGYYELADHHLLKERFEKSNQQRKEAGKESYDIDSRFIDATKAGMPACSGIAIGFDRVMMLALEEDEIDRIQTFSWDRA